jgi:aromatic-L-amino-acid/L-tryptophan decarboxylase
MLPLELSDQELREVLNRINDISLDYLNTLDERACFPGLNGEESQRLFNESVPEQGLGVKALDALTDVVRASRAQNGRFFAYVLGSGEPVAASGDLLASVLNQNVTAWRSGPAAVTIERTVIRWLAEAVGCKGFSGSLTGGGSSANLMGLAIAREAIAPANEAGAPRGVVYASSEVHMSIGKAVALLGLGRRNLRLVETDDKFRIVTGKLEKAIEADRKGGKQPIAIVASAGTVNTGAIDPLREVAEIARKYNMWLHIDGAYGGLAALAELEKFDGLGLADSISLDAHKWLYQPLDCGCLLYKEAAGAKKAFAHSGEYVKALQSDPIESFSFFEESAELSRRFRALKVWLSLRYHGLGAYRQAIRRDLEHARFLAELIAREPELELLATGELSAVCFRYGGVNTGVTSRESKELADRRNADVLARVICRGRVYLSNANIRGNFALRACFVNHRTTEKDVAEIVSEVLTAGREWTSPQ